MYGLVFGLVDFCNIYTSLTGTPIRFAISRASHLRESKKVFCHDWGNILGLLGQYPDRTRAEARDRVIESSKVQGFFAKYLMNLLPTIPRESKKFFCHDNGDFLVTAISEAHPLVPLICAWTPSIYY